MDNESKTTDSKNMVLYSKNVNGILVRKFNDVILNENTIFKKFFFKNSLQKTTCNVTLFSLCTNPTSDSEEYSLFITFNNNHTINLDDLIGGLVEIRTFFHKKGDETHPVTCITYKHEQVSELQKVYLNNVDTKLFNIIMYIVSSESF
jgi:hypothetical protein